MQRRPVSTLLALLAPLLLLAGIWLGGHPASLPPFLRHAFVDKDTETLSAAIDTIHDDYYRSISRSQLVGDSLGGVVGSLGDRFSHYLTPSEYKHFTRPATDKFAGVGISVVSESRGLKVVHVMDASPAGRAGIRTGDVIRAVDGHSLAGKPTEFATDRIRGKPGTVVALTMLRGGRSFVKRVERAQITVSAVESHLRTVRGRRVAVVHLDNFNSGAHGDLRLAIDRRLKQGAKGIVLDLSANGGGLLQESVLVSSIFIPEGTVVSTKGRTRPRHVYSATGNAIPTRIPVVVVVDRDTASAAEIVAGALQDRHRAKVVGTHTFGKGVFQELEGLPNGGALDITVGEFFTPSGHNLGGGGVRRGAGIAPNVAVRKGQDPLAVALATIAPALR